MKIIFFDGHCPMCHGWVKRIIRMDRRKVFRFAPLESATAIRSLRHTLPAYREGDTMVFLDGEKVYTRSTAILQIARSLGFPYILGLIGYCIPKRLRDAGYNFFARRRHKFGKRYDVCPLPPREWKDRFLDL